MLTLTPQRTTVNPSTSETQTASARAVTTYHMDPDQASRGWVAGLVGSVGGDVVSFERFTSLLRDVQPEQPGCILISVPRGEAGSVVRNLRGHGFVQPLILVAEDGTIADAVDAIKAGAQDFLLKPLNGLVVLEALQSAWRSESHRMVDAARTSQWRRRFACLTEREHEVLQCIVRGQISKEIGQELGISPRTVDAHRSGILRKMGGARISELVQMYVTHFRPTNEASAVPAPKLLPELRMSQKS